MADRARVHLLVSGRVQGVAFRAYTVDEARRLGVAGWVRNLPDGRVEAMFEGGKRDVEEMLLWCRRGPKYSYVDHVEEEWLPYQGDLAEFLIMR